MLDRVQSNAFRLISSSTLTDSLPSLSLRRDVASLFITVTISASVQWSCKVAFHLSLIDPEPADRPLKHTSMQLPSAKVELNVSPDRSFLLPLSFGMISLRRFFKIYMT